MGSSMFSSAILLLLAALAIFSAPTTLACGSCPSPKTPKSPVTVQPPVIGPPVIVPPIIGKPPVIVPPVIAPPISVKPPVIAPPVILPPISVKPPVTTIPPVTVPPVVGGTPPATGGCPSPPTVKEKTCPVDALKIGACLDILGETIKLGDPAVTCCEPLAGLAGMDAALCLCTTIKTKMLNINLVLPIGLQVLVNTCGKSIPPGYVCP